MSKLELQYKLDAISAALDNWNDIEVLRLVRAAWPDILKSLSERSGQVEQQVSMPSGRREHVEANVHTVAPRTRFSSDISLNAAATERPWPGTRATSWSENLKETIEAEP